MIFPTVTDRKLLCCRNGRGGLKEDRKPRQQVCVDEIKVLSGTRWLYKWKIVVKHGVVVSIITASLL